MRNKFWYYFLNISLVATALVVWFFTLVGINMVFGIGTVFGCMFTIVGYGYIFACGISMFIHINE